MTKEELTKLLDDLGYQNVGQGSYTVDDGGYNAIYSGVDLDEILEFVNQPRWSDCNMDDLVQDQMMGFMVHSWG
jgi:hypothetical protein